MGQYFSINIKYLKISKLSLSIDQILTCEIKVLPTDDNERYKVKQKFRQLLKFSKEVQVYMKIVKCMYM